QSGSAQSTRASKSLLTPSVHSAPVSVHGAVQSESVQSMLPSPSLSPPSLQLVSGDSHVKPAGPRAPMQPEAAQSVDPSPALSSASAQRAPVSVGAQGQSGSSLGKS